MPYFGIIAYKIIAVKKKNLPKTNSELNQYLIFLSNRTQTPIESTDDHFIYNLLCAVRASLIANQNRYLYGALVIDN